ncbi:MAG: hypothetical protein ACM31P_16410 [Actinomycetota bacterium]
MRLLLQCSISEENYFHCRYRRAPRDHLIHGALSFYNAGMHLSLIIVIGWLFVTGLAALTQESILIGLVAFLFTGALPCGLIFYFAGSNIRRQRRQYREMMAERERKNTGE